MQGHYHACQAEMKLSESLNEAPVNRISCITKQIKKPITKRTTKLTKKIEAKKARIGAQKSVKGHAINGNTQREYQIPCFSDRDECQCGQQGSWTEQLAAYDLTNFDSESQGTVCSEQL